VVVGYDFFRLGTAAREQQRRKNAGPVFADFAEEEQRLTGFSSLCDHLAFNTCIQNLHAGLAFTTRIENLNSKLACRMRTAQHQAKINASMLKQATYDV